MGKKHWLLRRVGAVMMTTGLLSSGIWGGAGSGLSAPVVWAQEETTAPAADTARPKQLPGKPGEPGSAIKSLTVTADPDNKDKVVLNVDFAFPDDAKPGDYVDVIVETKGSKTQSAFLIFDGDVLLKDRKIGKTIAVVSSTSSGYRVTLQPEAEGLVNRTAQFTRTEIIPTVKCDRDPASLKYTATTIDSQGNEHVWDLYTTTERCKTNTNPEPRGTGTIAAMPIPMMECGRYGMGLEYFSVANEKATQGAGVYGLAEGRVYVTPPIGDAGAANETFQDIYVRVRVDDAQTPMKMTELSQLLEAKLNGDPRLEYEQIQGFANKNGGWEPGDLDTKYPKGTPVPPQAYVYPPDFDIEGVKAKAQPGTNGLSESFDWNSKAITQKDAIVLGKLFAEVYKAWEESHKPEVIGSNTDPANGTVYVDYKIPGLYKPVIMKNAWGEPVASLRTNGRVDFDEDGNADSTSVGKMLSKSALYRIRTLGFDVFAPYSGAANYNTILTYSTDPESYKSGQGHIENSAHYGSCGEADVASFAAQEGIAAGDPLPSKPDTTPTSSSAAPTSSSSSSVPSTTSSSTSKSAPSTTSIEPSSTTSAKTTTSAVVSTTSREPSTSVVPAPVTSSAAPSPTNSAENPSSTTPVDSTTPEETTTSEKPVESEPSSTLSTPVESTTADKPEESTPVEPTPVVPDVPEESVEPQRPQRLEPGIAVVKKINGRIAREGEGVETQAGTDMAITFEVTNTGNTTLKDVVVGDDVITDSDAIVCDDADRVLAAGEVMTCSASYPAPEAGGKHINTVTVTGVPVDEDGHELESGEVMAKDVAKAHTPPEVHDDSEGVVKTPGISVTKLVNGEDADVAPGVMVASGSGMEFVFDVANTGDVALTGIELGDDVIASEDIVCADKPEILAPGEHFVCRASLVAPESGGHVNIATVEAIPVYADGEFGSDALVRDCDVAHAKVVPSESESRSEELVDVDEPEVDESVQHDGGVSSEPEGSQEHGASVIVQQVVQHGGFVDKKAASTTVKKSGVRVTTGGHLRAA
ncbi:hypothetical protein [Corynebacterium sp. sy039]|uniref:DUF7507 domain-containing protein n=1 Tax=Corynebacterium sp. sy039 TaxID=2599641 RepID=UPI0011B8053E|nr:hypothetical protein [Corynebacterium sp. sy039]QDZ41960.1 hypothetical protein FQV43_01335 [Corynebacterium sp. sy039]